jgi:hypothetical protein
MIENNMIDNKGTADMVDSISDISEKGKISYVVRGWREKIGNINRKYSNPRLKMTPLVRATLLALRLYLIMLVSILIYKFYTLIR